MLKKLAAALPIAALLCSVTAIPAQADNAQPAAPRPAAATDCLNLTVQLQTDITAAATGLAAVPPNVSAVTTALTGALGVVADLQAANCLPSLTGPLTPGPCLAATAQLSADLDAVLAALVSVPPNLTAAATALAGVTTELQAEITGGCLSVLPLPPLPLPSLAPLPLAPATSA